MMGETEEDGGGEGCHETEDEGAHSSLKEGKYRGKQGKVVEYLRMMWMVEGREKVRR